MAKYRILEPLVFGEGVLGLSDEQYATRRHALKPLGKGQYQVVGEVQFKAGEVIEYGAALSKYMIGKLQLLSSSSSPAKAKD
jgi:hypothetical protein